MPRSVVRRAPNGLVLLRSKEWRGSCILSPMVTAKEILGARILIVDDRDVNILLLDRMLRGAGYTAVTSTTNPLEVCALHGRQPFDLILLDLQMPGMDGFQVMEALKQIETVGYIPVLVISAQPTEKLRALHAGAKDFISKPFDLSEVLLRVHNMLEVRLLHLETIRLYARVMAEQQISDRLLLNVLPFSIVERLKGRPEVTASGFSDVIADSFSDVTVLFADIVEFTPFSRTVSPEILVGILNDIFTRFDGIADARGLEKIKTIGDAYMAVAGAPVPVLDHANRAANMALDMLEAIDDFNSHSPHTMHIRIGIDSGAAVAGVIGKRKFQYDVWGDAVNTASRMESTGRPDRVQVSDATRQRLSASFVVEDRGDLEVKGRGVMHTWFLNGRGSAPKWLPEQTVRPETAPACVASDESWRTGATTVPAG